MMPRVVEPELMDELLQAQAYAEADFDAPHGEIVDHFARVFGNVEGGEMLDLGCGPADVTLRFARRYPRLRIDGVDGAAAMLEHGRRRIARAGLTNRVRLTQCVLPTDSLPRAAYGTVISTSLLHHLHEPAVLWKTVKHAAAPAARIFIADLLRPRNAQIARELVAQYSADEPPVLRRDFYNSLCAAFTVEEVRAQLIEAGLEQLAVEAVSDRHLIIWGVCA
jgi:ubiquinone/menaquinone biosynthesis C-methylase UbiE